MFAAKSCEHLPAPRREVVDLLACFIERKIERVSELALHAINV